MRIRSALTATAWAVVAVLDGATAASAAAPEPADRDRDPRLPPQRRPAGTGTADYVPARPSSD
ncbi:hypothetical protein [Streptomyces sp. ODS28]|uniref:hypothetical protein n=1 Tax=Streptomyces sp. ODS28 TaxID=3136688 RepID=UPI0031E61B82